MLLASCVTLSQPPPFPTWVSVPGLICSPVKTYFEGKDVTVPQRSSAQAPRTETWARVPGSAIY